MKKNLKSKKIWSTLNQLEELDKPDNKNIPLLLLEPR